MYLCYYNKSIKINIESILAGLSKNGITVSPEQIIFQTSELLVILFTEKKIFQEDKDCLLLGTINIYNKDDLENSYMSDHEQAAFLYKKYGHRFVEFINGDFSLLIWNKIKKELIIARDPIGHYALYYFYDNDRIMVSSFLPYLLYQTEQKTINQDFINVALNSNVSEKNQTVYNQIFRFVPASIYTVGKNNFTVKKYWNLKYHESKQGKPVDYLDQFYEKFKNAVIKRMISGKNGFEVSGGIDSSSIICTALKNTNNEIFSFSHILPDEAIDKFKPFVDERKYIQKIKEKYPGLKSIYIPYSSASIIDDIREYIKYSKDLPQQQLQIMSNELYRQAGSNNIDALFSGFGGDEVISSSGYYHFLQLTFSNRYDKLLKTIFQRKHNRQSFIRFILKKIVEINLYKLGMNNNVTGKYQKDLFIKQPLLDKILADSNARNEEPPVKNYYYAKLEEAITRRHITSRIENCNIAGSRYGFEFKHPMVDKELLEYYFSLPYEAHNTPNWPRNIIRQIMREIVPDEIINRRDKIGGTIPNVPYRIFHDQHQIREYINGYNRKSYIASLIDLDSFSDYFEKILQLSQIKSEKINHRSLINYLTILIFFDLFDNGELF